MDSPLQAPPVVAVVVTCDSGPWLEEALEALADQDYPNFSVLVIDANSAVDPTARVADVLPGAYVRRLSTNPGYAAATNEALGLVEGASHFLLCHDDVAPFPDAVRLMVEEAFRSNAGLVAPKLVDWTDPRRLLQVGLAADKSGAPKPLVDRGELDQEQHDAVRDVFVAPGGCTLVRADLFASLGGFDPAMHLYGEDLDLSWRAQVAGARVVVAPSARVRHREAMSAALRSPGGGPPPRRRTDLRRLARPLVLRHRLRAVLKNYSSWHLIRVLPQVALLAVAEMMFGVLAGHTATARDTASAWTWNARRLRDIRAARKVVRRSRQVPDSAVRHLQARGSARFSLFLRGQLASDRFRRRTRGALERARHLEIGDDERAPIGLSLAVLGAVALVLLAGSRHLITRGLPAVHQLGPLPGAWEMLRSFGSGWHPSGLGSESAAPAALGFLGVAGTLLGGATGLLRTLLVVGSLPLGAAGAMRLAGPLGSQRARLAALVAYVAIPLPYNAIANGSLHGVLAYAAAPWVLRALLRATAIPPFDDSDGGAPNLGQVILPLGMLVALVAAVAPAFALVVLVMGLALFAGSLVAGDVLAAGRAVGAAFGAVALAAVLLVPWSVDFALPGSQLSSLTGVGGEPARAFGLGAVLRFQTGPLGAPPLGWAFVAGAALPLLVGRGWRLAWAGRMWCVAVSFWGLAWASGRGWLVVGAPDPEVLLAPAAAALALAVALGAAAYEADVPGYRFGWRQLAPTVALVVVLLGTLPVAGAAVGGRWHTPRQDFAGLLSWMPEQREAGDFRVLWVGDPQALPLTGWRLSEGLAYATSRNGAPDASDLWPSASAHAAQRLADAVQVARAEGTTSLGHLLAPAAVRYVVVPLAAAPSRATTARRPPPPDLAAALDAQVDLKKLQGDDSLLVYENAAWAPLRAKLPAGAATEGQFELAALRSVELAGSAPVLPRQRSATSFTGPLTEADNVLLAEGSSSRWQLRVDGRSAPRSEAFGWANAFVAPATGEASLRYRTSPLRYGFILGQAALWVVALRMALVARRARAAVR